MGFKYGDCAGPELRTGLCLKYYTLFAMIEIPLEGIVRKTHKFHVVAVYYVNAC